MELSIRSASLADAEGIARIFLESAELHAGLDPERYFVPEIAAIAARYREGRQFPGGADTVGTTIVAESGGEIVGFVDARLDSSPDPSHREMIFCHVEELAVRHLYQNQGIGERLLRAAEEWGRSKGAGFALLEYHAQNLRAERFYRQRMRYQVASITAIKRL